MPIRISVSSSRFGTVADLGTDPAVRISVPRGGSICLVADPEPTAQVRDAKGNTLRAVTFGDEEAPAR